MQNALNACPDEPWRGRLWFTSESQPEFGEFWHIAYHANFWLDYYCSDSANEFTVPAPFTFTELEMDTILPKQPYTKPELQSYLKYARDKCRAKIASLANENEPQRIRGNWRVKTIAELMLYNMRHVQEHAAHLGMLLGQKTSSAPGWVGQVSAE